MRKLFYAIAAVMCGALVCLSSAEAQAGYWDSHYDRDYTCRKVWTDYDEWELRCHRRHYPRRYSCEERQSWDGDWKLRCQRRHYYERSWRYDD